MAKKRYEVETQSGTIIDFMVGDNGDTTFMMIGGSLVAGLVDHFIGTAAGGKPVKMDFNRFINTIRVGEPVEMDFYKERSMTCPAGLARYQHDASYLRTGPVKRITQIAVPTSAVRT